MPTNLSPDAKSYNGVQQHHSFETEGGFAICPVAGRTPAFRRIRLHGGYALRRVKWSADRSGVPPFIPAATDIGTTDLLLSYTVTPSLPAPDPQNAGYNWHVEGEYLYVQVNPRVAGVDALPTGSFPFPVTPNDQVAQGLYASTPGVAGYIATMEGLGATSYGPGPIYNLLGQRALSGTTLVWPFTALPAAFTSNTLFGA